jgi:transposase
MTTLTEGQWSKIYTFLCLCSGVYVKNEAKTRRFVEAILWIVRTGAQWRELPEKYGKWNSVAQRFRRWCQRGLWETLLAELASEPDLECLLLDSTIIRAHPCAAGAPTQLDDAPDQALGRSRGGFSTKIHIVVDALGNPLDFVLTAGQAHDVKQAPGLLTGRRTDYVIADKGYDSDALLEFIEQMGAIPIIPARKNRTEPRYIDWHLSKERHLIECFINKIKWYRRIFSRFDKLAKHFLGFLSFVASLIWLR